MLRARVCDGLSRRKQQDALLELSAEASAHRGAAEERGLACDGGSAQREQASLAHEDGN